MQIIKKTVLYFTVISIIVVLIANVVIFNKSNSFIYDDVPSVPACYTAIVLGAKVSDEGIPSNFLQDRLDVALELYRNKKVTRFLLSGDHGRAHYDEVNGMKNYLLKHGIDTADIFLDHAGFDTYNTMVRATKIFQVKDAIIVSQDFHLPRAVYIARSKGITAYGITANRQNYHGMGMLKFRDVFAKVKAFLEVAINKNPHHLGSQIPITGDSRLSYD